jgi:hypothetical protein
VTCEKVTRILSTQVSQFPERFEGANHGTETGPEQNQIGSWVDLLKGADPAQEICEFAYISHFRFILTLGL